MMIALPLLTSIPAAATVTPNTAVLPTMPSAVTAGKWKGLPMELAIKRVRGTGQRELIVFSDPNCSYCKRLESVLSTIDNLTVHLFIIPIVSSNSVDKASGILCDSDPGAAWDAWMLTGKELAPNAQCDTRTQQLLELGKRLQVNGTPTLLFSDGQRINGLVSADVIEQGLTKASVAS